MSPGSMIFWDLDVEAEQEYKQAWKCNPFSWLWNTKVILTALIWSNILLIFEFVIQDSVLKG